MTPGSPFLKTLNSVGIPPSIQTYTTIAGTQKNDLTNWMLRSEPNDGVVEMDSVQSVGGIAYDSFTDHNAFSQDGFVLLRLTAILNGNYAQKAQDPIPQQSVSIPHDYQEAPLITGAISTGQEDHLVQIDPTAAKIRFILANPAGGLSLHLTTPGGKLITPDTVSGETGITYMNEGTTLIGYEVNLPQSGTWTLHVVVSGTPSAPVEYALYTMLDAGLKISSSMDTLYVANQPIKLTAYLTNAGTPLIGANAEVHIRATAGASQTLALYDDGTHGDLQANDGVYTANFQPGAGTYVITLQASGMIQGQAFAREKELMIWARHKISLPLVAR
jgi:hypothetical protein